MARQLAPQLIDLARLGPGDKVLDVGCGPGALTTELVARLGAASVSAVDPSEPFVAAVRARHPGIEIQLAAAEALPYDNGVFDAALAQLVVHLMADPAAGLREMVRVTRTDGVVAACVWDFAGGKFQGSDLTGLKIAVLQRSTDNLATAFALLSSTDADS